jgi:hypothetical protein
MIHLFSDNAVAERVHVSYKRRQLQWEYLAAFVIEFSTVESANFTHIREMIATALVTALPLPPGTNRILYLATTRVKIQEGVAIEPVATRVSMATRRAIPEIKPTLF